MSIKFLAYLTANDDRFYIKDLLNFTNMCKYNPGVEHMEVFVAISAVRPFDSRDVTYIKQLVSIFSNCPWVTLKKVILKGNVGRDFSSAYVCLKEIGKNASDNDVVMVKNRSGYGPLYTGWFGAYEKLLSSDSVIGLVGSTINFSNHPKAKYYGVSTHVQTYVYMSVWKHLAAMADIFPAVSCVDRVDLIVEGEIGLSRMFLNKGLALACLAWPDELFTRERLTNPLLPQADIKRKVKNVPIRYKFKSYGRWQVISKGLWVFSEKIKQGTKGEHDMLITYSTQYGDVGSNIKQLFPEWC